MKNAFEYLNDVKMNLDMYEEEIMSEKEIRKVSRMVKGGRKNYKKIITVAACAAVAALAGTAIACGYAGEIVKVFTTGHNSFVQTAPEEEYILPKELKGYIFDADGNEVTVMTEEDETGVFYDKDGNVLDEEGYARIFDEAYDGKVEIDINKYEDEYPKKIFATIHEAQKSANFDIKLPGYVPEGWEMSRIYTFTDDDGSFNGDYMTIEYKNGDLGITINERAMNEETAFVLTTDDDIEKIDINGREAVITNDRNIDFETEDEVSVGISGKGNLSRGELIKIAQSVE